MKKYFLTVVSFFVFAIVPSKVFAQDATTVQAQITNYLPYILIGGAAILLISIIGILFSKKKDDNTEIVLPQAITPIESTTSAEPPVEQSTTPATVNMDDISKNLYSSAEDKPAIQETMESTSTPEEQPITQPTFVQDQSPMSQQDQSSDLQDILQGESSASPMGPVTDHVEDAPVVTPTEPQVSQPTFVQPQVEATPVVPDLQQFIDTQATQVPPIVEPATQAPVVAPVEDSNPVADSSTPTPTTPGIV